MIEGIEGFSSLPYGERLLGLGLWTLKEKKSRWFNSSV